MLTLSNRRILVASTTAILWGLYFIYASVISPRLSVTQPHARRKGVNSTPALGPVDNVEKAQTYLASAPWAERATYMFRTRDAYVYAQDWNEVDSSDAIRFEPFAMVWFKEFDDQSDEPVTMIAESALVVFASKFDFATNPDPGRVIGGQLEGKVHISGPNNLSVDGHNFIFSESELRVWSDDDLKFAYGTHQGSGHGLQIDLIPPQGPPLKDELAVSGIRKIHLRRNVVMDLLLEDESEVRTVNIKSDGPFEFELETNIASFADKVRVRRPTSDSEQDTLDCHQLKLFFEENPDDSATAIAKADAVDPALQDAPASSTDGDADDEVFQSIDSNLTFRRLLATGNSGKDVLLTSQANSLTALMSELRYDSQTRIAALLAGESVDVKQKNNAMTCPEITLVHNPDGQVETVWCRGVGQLQQHDIETKQLTLNAKWQKQLHKYPDPKTGFDVIELLEQAEVNQPTKQSLIRAETIRLWVEHIEQSAAASPFDKTPGMDAKFRPHHLVALKNVEMVSPELIAYTKHLQAWFEESSAGASDVEISWNHPRPRPNRLLVPAVHRVPPTRRSPHRGRNQSARHFAGQAFASTRDPIPSQSAALRGAVSPARKIPMTTAVIEQPDRVEAADDPLVVSADLIRVLVEQAAAAGGQGRVKEVWTEGQVHITQKRESGELPLDLTGDRLHLRNRSERDQVVHVHGKPARIKDNGLNLEGKEIYLDRPRNFTWIEGEGVLRLPVEQDLDGNPLEQPEMLAIAWNEQMTFDGIQADFFGNVHAKLQHSHMRCHEMRVELTNKILFSQQSRGIQNGSLTSTRGSIGVPPDQHSQDAEPTQQEADVHNVLCRDDVEFDSYDYDEHKNLIGIRKARFGLFALNQKTGQTEGHGPGWVIYWNSRAGKGKRAALAPTAVAQANRPLQSETVDWEYTRVNFSGRMSGNLHEKHTTFQGQVKIVHGPIKQPPDYVDPDLLPRDAALMNSSTLFVSQQPATQTRPSHIDLFASGNAKLEGRSFVTSSDTISYDGYKKMFILRSRGNRKASIWRQERIGGEWKEAVAQRVEFIPSKNQLRLFQTTGAQGQQ